MNKCKNPCVECVYAKQRNEVQSPFYCMHESALISIDYVGGEDKHETCSSWRCSGDNRCTSSGLYFKQNENEK